MGMFIGIDKTGEKIDLTNDERVFILRGLAKEGGEWVSGGWVLNTTVDNLIVKIDNLHRIETMLSTKEIRAYALRAFRSLRYGENSFTIIHWIKEMRSMATKDGSSIGLKEAKEMVDSFVDDGWVKKDAVSGFMSPDLLPK
jgi:hypothetical protein